MTQTNKIIAERDAFARKAQILESLVQDGARNDRMMPADRVAARSAVQTLAEAINADPALVQAAVDEAANNAFAPVTAVITARQKVGAEFPEFGQFEPEVSQYLNANPEVAAEYNSMMANPGTAAAGMRYAFLMATQAARANAQATTTTQVTPTDASGQAQATARLDALLPGGAGGGGGGRAAALDAAEAARGAELRAAARKAGSGPAMAAYLEWAWGDQTQGH